LLATKCLVEGCPRDEDEAFPYSLINFLYLRLRNFPKGSPDINVGTQLLIDCLCKRLRIEFFQVPAQIGILYLEFGADHFGKLL
jgi:hypothetical protein